MKFKIVCVAIMCALFTANVSAECRTTELYDITAGFSGSQDCANITSYIKEAVGGEYKSCRKLQTSDMYAVVDKNGCRQDVYCSMSNCSVSGDGKSNV